MDDQKIILIAVIVAIVGFILYTMYEPKSAIRTHRSVSGYPPLGPMTPEKLCMMPCIATSVTWGDLSPSEAQLSCNESCDGKQFPASQSCFEACADYNRLEGRNSGAPCAAWCGLSS